MKKPTIEMSYEPPSKEGYWWVWDGKAEEPVVCEVSSRFNEDSGKHVLYWSFIDGLTWNLVSKYRSYKWAYIQMPATGK